MQSEPIATTGALKRRWWTLGAAARDEVDVFPTEVVIHQRTAGAGDVHLPMREITEVRTQGDRLHLRVGSKKYVLRRLKRDELERLAAAIGQAQQGAS